MAISWLYRADYSKAGFPMLTVIEPRGRRAGRHAVLFAAALVPVTLLPSFLQVCGPVYGATAAVLGIALLWLASRFARMRTDESARLLFFGSIIYLPILWIAMIGDKL
jgi:protoheme IX farnesyltransferase